MSITKKTNRKNKTNQEVKWLSGFFTIKQLLAANSHFREITLRSRIDAAKTANQISAIGCIHNGKGRPQLAFAMTPVSKEILESARQAGVLFNEQYDSIAVVSVNAMDIPTTAAAATTAAKIDSAATVNA